MEKWRENKKAYTAQFQKDNYKNISFRLSLKNENDIINHLKSKDNIKQYIVSLIKKDMQN